MTSELMSSGGNLKVSPLPPPLPLYTIHAQNQSNVVEILSKGGESISTVKHVSLPKNRKSTLKLAKVEVVEMVEIFSVYLVKMHLKSIP
jgi:hypothetical protein